MFEIDIYCLARARHGELRAVSFGIARLFTDRVRVHVLRI